MDELTLEQQQAIALANARAREAQAQPKVGYEYTNDIPTPIGSTKQTPSNWYDFGYAHTAPASYGEILSNAWDASKLAGLAPEVLPIGGFSRLPAAQKVAQAGSTAASVAGMPLKSVAQIAKEILPESTQTAYQIGKQYTKPLAQAWSEGKRVGLPVGTEKSSAIANYFKAFFPQANQADISKATSMSKQAGGVWDVAKKAQEAEQKVAQIGGRYNMTFPQNANLVLPEARQVGEKGISLAQAGRAGKEATWLPSTPLKLIDMAASLFHPTTGIPFALATSPRLQANAAYAVGRGQNLARQIPLTTEDLINLSLLAPRLQDQGQ
jgi:hypothetical protein